MRRWTGEGMQGGARMCKCDASVLCVHHKSHKPAHRVEMPTLCLSLRLYSTLWYYRNIERTKNERDRTEMAPKIRILLWDQFETGLPPPLQLTWKIGHGMGLSDNVCMSFLARRKILQDVGQMPNIVDNPALVQRLTCKKTVIKKKSCT